MTRLRIIPTLLIDKNGGLVKTIRFSKRVYIGDPINAVRIFNDKEVDEILILDIDASKNNREPNFRSIEDIVSETAPLRPISPYGLTKKFQSQLAEYYTQTTSLPIVIARTFNLLGDGQSADIAIGSFSNKIDKTEPQGTIVVGNIDIIRDYISADRAAELLWTAMLHGLPGQTYNICSGIPTSMRSVLETMIALSGKKLKIVSQKPDPKDILYMVGNPQKLLQLKQVKP